MYRSIEVTIIENHKTYFFFCPGCGKKEDAREEWKKLIAQVGE